MSSISATQSPSTPVDRPTPVAIPVRAVLPWAFFLGLLALIALYFVGAEQGATSVFSGATLHEFVHDGRHLLGFPCH
ncbi:CbtB domain-containing protein [Motilibacter deserti]|uniref:CbtB-domain containing protein n=1 Tax=Motilibacter deserti TaxID=2714956 RepID=A0ABX0GQ75_9ACTN|nr:CbtB-domain containing protein [Motilibacter deserti]NHC12276.1 CbtB-domain containing protein [Motilibacter deserti]